MVNYIVKLLPKAYQDIEQIYKYISESLEEKEIALKLIDNIQNTIFSLEKLPYRGTERKIGVFSNKGYRQLFYENFNIIYRIDEEKKYVVIVTIRYSRSNF